MRAQALAQLRELSPSVPPSAIADALGKAGGNVHQAADLLFKAVQERPVCTLGTRRASLLQLTDVVRPQCAVGTHMCTHERTSMGTRKGKLTQAVVRSGRGLRRAA